MDIINYLKSINKLNGGQALDVGSGQGFITNKLAEIGFSVDSIDKNNSDSEDIRIYDLKTNNYDLIIARNVLPFLSSREETFTVINKLFSGLKSGGVMYFTIFGPKDDWANDPKMTFLEYDDVLSNLPGKVLKQGTEFLWGPTMAGEMKHWHIHHFVIEK